jgi:hypothetical protein
MQHHQQVLILLLLQKLLLTLLLLTRASGIHWVALSIVELQRLLYWVSYEPMHTLHRYLTLS